MPSCLRNLVNFFVIGSLILPKICLLCPDINLSRQFLEISFVSWKFDSLGKP